MIVSAGRGPSPSFLASSSPKDALTHEKNGLRPQRCLVTLVLVTLLMENKAVGNERAAAIVADDRNTLSAGRCRARRKNDGPVLEIDFLHVAVQTAYPQTIRLKAADDTENDMATIEDVRIPSRLPRTIEGNAICIDRLRGHCVTWGSSGNEQ